MDILREQEQKSALRKKVLEERSSLDEELWEQKSEQIRTFLEQVLHREKAEAIHCYVSMNQRREVNTHPLIKNMLSEGRQVYVPVTDFEEGTLSHVRLKSFGQLHQNKWGVLEPEVPEPEPVDQFDVIIIPMAAADRQGNRLGYGKGFYDRFLSSCKGLKIGLTFDRFIKEKIPSEDFDVKMDMLISEKGTIET